jgi:hypothetical protein
MDTALTDEAPITREARRIEGDARYTAEANFIRATTFGALNWWLGIPGALAGVAAATSIVADGAAVLSGALALAASLLITAQTIINPDRRSNEHTQQGNAYRALQAEARVFRSVDFDHMNGDQRRARLSELMQSRAELNARNRPGERAFQKAKMKIESGDLDDDDD